MMYAFKKIGLFDVSVLDRIQMDAGFISRNCIACNLHPVHPTSRMPTSSVRLSCVDDSREAAEP